MGDFSTKLVPYRLRGLLIPPMPLMKSPFNSQMLGTVLVRKVLGSRSKTWNRSDMGPHMATEAASPVSVFSPCGSEGCFSKWPAKSQARPTSLDIERHQEFPCSELRMPCTHPLMAFLYT